MRLKNQKKENGNDESKECIRNQGKGSANAAAGTGKTLVARALAATASKAGTKVSFFMRKGADVLSKWVGEAERQLRLLFEEAQKAQPAIIFFDEIDGLAPVSQQAFCSQCSVTAAPFCNILLSIATLLLN